MERPQVNNNSSATVMLGLEGMAVLAVSERDGELEYAIETTAATGWCLGFPSNRGGFLYAASDWMAAIFSYSTGASKPAELCRRLRL
jgi:hypothetical protein